MGRYFTRAEIQMTNKDMEIRLTSLISTGMKIKNTLEWLLVRIWKNWNIPTLLAAIYNYSGKQIDDSFLDMYPTQMKAFIHASTSTWIFIKYLI